MVDSSQLRIANLLSQTDFHLETMKELIKDPGNKVSESALNRLIQTLVKDQSELTKELNKPLSLKGHVHLDDSLHSHILSTIGFLQKNTKTLERMDNQNNVLAALWKVLENIKADVAKYLNNRVNLEKGEDVEKVEMWTRKYFSKSDPMRVIYADLEVSSPAFSNGDRIPDMYTCLGADVSPPLMINKVPQATKTFVIILEDPDAPKTTFTHWLAWNIPKENLNIPENVELAILGRNDFGYVRYNGPCPPPGKVHHYHFKVYALDTAITLPRGSGKSRLLNAMEKHIVAFGELVGLFSK